METTQTAALLEKPLIFSPAWPIVFAILAAGVFAYLAFRFRRSIALWAASAGLSTLVLASSAAGLFHAIAVPYSEARRGSLQTIAMLLTLLVIAAGAGLAFFLASRTEPGLEVKPNAPGGQPNIPTGQAR